jgi:Transposase DDE domain
MSPGTIIGWVLTVAHTLRASQAKTLADLVAAATRVGWATLSAIGRSLSGSSFAKHEIKRTWRFCDNDRIEPSQVMRAVVARICKRRKKPLLVSFDWTDIRRFHTLVAAAVMRTRSVPLLWASYTDGQLRRSRNAHEESLLRLLVSMLPKNVRVILLADRGFGRTELAKTCLELGVRFLIRIKPDVRITHPEHTGRLDEYPVKKGMWRVLAGAQYRSDKAVVLNVVVRWPHGLPEKRDQPWFLMTDLAGNAVALTKLFARRMAVAELFRDTKDGRYGFGLARTQLTSAARLDRLILILALALVVLVGVGRLARGQFRPGAWCSSNDPGECSDLTVGRRMLDRLDAPPEQMMELVVRATCEAIGNWG